MSSAVISTSAAQGRFFVFDESLAEVSPPFVGNARRHADAQQAHPATRAQSAISNQKSKVLASVTPASRLALRSAPEMVSSGIAAIDTLSGGLPRGGLTEIFGPASSGRTTLLLAALAAATRRGEVCAVVDASDALDPQSVAASGIDLEHLLWVRCGGDSLSEADKKNLKNKQIHKFQKIESRFDEHRLEQLLRVTDLLLESGGFGLIALDLCDLPVQIARLIPLTTWFRFRRAVEHTPTVLLAIERQSIAGSCSSLLLKLDAAGNRKREQSMNFAVSKPAHSHLLTGLEITAEIIRSRVERKPAASVATTFSSKAAWGGMRKPGCQ